MEISFEFTQTGEIKTYLCNEDKIIGDNLVDIDCEDRDQYFDNKVVLFEKKYIYIEDFLQKIKNGEINIYIKQVDLTIKYNYGRIITYGETHTNDIWSETSDEIIDTEFDYCPLISINFTEQNKYINIYFCEYDNYKGNIVLDGFEKVIVNFIDPHFKILERISVKTNDAKELVIESLSDIDIDDINYFENLCDTLEALTITELGHNTIKINCSLNNLPFNLKKLSIRAESVKYPLETIPVGVECLLINIIDYPYEIPFPPNLKHLMLICKKYEFGIYNVPDSVELLCISHPCIENPVKFPKKLKCLVYHDCPNELYDEIANRKLKIMILKKQVGGSRKREIERIHKCCA